MVHAADSSEPGRPRGGERLIQAALLGRRTTQVVLVGIALGALLGCAAARQLTPSHEEAARQLVRLLLSEPLLDVMVEAAAEEGMQTLRKQWGEAASELTEAEWMRVRTALEVWAREVLTFAEVEDIYVRAFGKELGEQELEELTALLRAPTGGKLLRLYPQLLRRAGAARVNAALERGEFDSPELTDAVRELFAQAFTESEIEELKRFRDRFLAVRVPQKGGQLAQRLLAEVNREARVLTPGWAARRLGELLRRALPDRASLF